MSISSSIEPLNQQFLSHVDIDGLSLRFGDQYLFRNFNFKLPKGRFSSLLGGSGVGKSTLLRIIAGLHTDFEGKINFCNGTNLAYMAQHDALYPWLSVIDNVQLNAHLLGQKSTATYAKATQLLAQVKMDKHIHKHVYELSGGQRQRVALARTLMTQANLVLMDEPFSALDAVTRHELQTLTHQLLKDKTVLFITHDPQEAICLSDDIYVLKHQPATISLHLLPQGAPMRAFDHKSFGQIYTKLLANLVGDV